MARNANNLRQINQNCLETFYNMSIDIQNEKYFVIHFGRKSIKILQDLMFLRGIKADKKVKLGINFEDVLNKDQKQCL